MDFKFTLELSMFSISSSNLNGLHSLSFDDALDKSSLDSLVRLQIDVGDNGSFSSVSGTVALTGSFRV